MTHFGTKECARLGGGATELAGHKTEAGGQLQRFAELYVARLCRLREPAAAQLWQTKCGLVFGLRHAAYGTAEAHLEYVFGTQQRPLLGLVEQHTHILAALELEHEALVPQRRLAATDHLGGGLAEIMAIRVNLYAYVQIGWLFESLQALHAHMQIPNEQTLIVCVAHQIGAHFSLHALLHGHNEGGHLQ